MGAAAAIGFLTVVSVSEQRKTAKRTQKAQEEATAVERATRAHEARKARREQIREARIRQAQIENVAATSGQTGSSAAVAAGSSLQGRLGTNVGDIQTALQTSSLKSTAEQNIFDASRKSTAEILSGAGLNLFALAK